MSAEGDDGSRKRKMRVKPEDEFDDDDGNDKKRGKFPIKFLKDKNKRHITFSKRKQGILKKAAELSILTGTQVLLLVASENGNVTHFATKKFESMLNGPGAPCPHCKNLQNARDMITHCLTTDDDDQDGDSDEEEEKNQAGPAYEAEEKNSRAAPQNRQAHQQQSHQQEAHQQQTHHQHQQHQNTQQHHQQQGSQQIISPGGSWPPPHLGHYVGNAPVGMPQQYLQHQYAPGYGDGSYPNAYVVPGTGGPVNGYHPMSSAGPKHGRV